MPSYRLEEAPSARAGCQNKECKDNKIKILKGELRLGTWVDNERFQSFFWRHWGCVTPKIVGNLNETVEEMSSGEEKDFSNLDGFEELSSENQEKVKRALEQGHVDDADWKGDPEMNQPGKVGFRKRVSKKAKANEDQDDASEDEKPASKAKAKPKKRGAKAVADEDDEAEKQTPKAKKTKTAAATPTPKGSSSRPKKAAPAVAPPSDDDETKSEADFEAEPEPEPQPKRRGRAAKTSDSKPVATPKASKTGAGTAKRQKKQTEEETAVEPVIEDRPKRGRKKKTTA